MGDRLRVRVTPGTISSPPKREVMKDQIKVSDTSYYHTVQQLRELVHVLGAIDISKPDFRGAHSFELCGAEMISNFIDIINTGIDLMSSLRWEEGEK